MTKPEMEEGWTVKSVRDLGAQRHLTHLRTPGLEP